MRYSVCLFIVVVLVFCDPALGDFDRCNLTLISQNELYNLSDVLLEQRYSHDNGIDLLSMTHSLGHHSQKLNSPSEYLNDTELSCVMKSSDILIQSYQDMINESNSLFAKADYNKSLQVYDNFTKLEAMLADVWTCRCAAMRILFEENDRNRTSYTGWDEDMYLKCGECDGYWEMARDGETSWAVKDLRENMTKAKAELDSIKENEESRAAFNASGISVVDGDYNSFKITVPIGPFNMSFQTRISGEMSVTNYTLQQEAGSGKSYHFDNFTVYEYSMPPNLIIKVATFDGPASYQPSSPFDDYETAESRGKYNVYYDEPIKIDGVTGQETIAYYAKNPDKRDRYVISYSPEKGVFVQIRSNLDYDSDISLIIETMDLRKSSK